MPEHQDLHLLRSLRAAQENEQLKQTADYPIDEGKALKQQTPNTHPPTLRAHSDPSSPSSPSAATGDIRAPFARFWDPQAWTEAVIVPSHHGGFLGGEFGMTDDPDGFGVTLRRTLAEEH